LSLQWNVQPQGMPPVFGNSADMNDNEAKNNPHPGT